MAVDMLLIQLAREVAPVFPTLPKTEIKNTLAPHLSADYKSGFIL